MPASLTETGNWFLQSRSWQQKPATFRSFSSKPAVWEWRHYLFITFSQNPTLKQSDCCFKVQRNIYFDLTVRFMKMCATYSWTSCVPVCFNSIYFYSTCTVRGDLKFSVSCLPFPHVSVSVCLPHTVTLSIWFSPPENDVRWVSGVSKPDWLSADPPLDSCGLVSTEATRKKENSLWAGVLPQILVLMTLPTAPI